MKSLIEYINESTNEINGFCILKPEFLDHTDDFLALLNNNDWKIIQKKKLLLTKDQAKDLYSPHKDKVRKNWGKDEMKNGMHSSDSLENVNRESKIIF